MAGVGPAQQPLARVKRHAGGGDEVAARAGPLDQGRVGPAQQPPRIVGEGRGGGERRPHERCPPPGLQAVPDDVADDQHRGVLRAFGDEVEVAADPLGAGGQEGGGQLQAGAPGNSGGVSASRIARRSSSSCSAVSRRPRSAASSSSRTAASRRSRAISVSWIVPLCGLMAHDLRGVSSELSSRAPWHRSARRVRCPCTSTGRFGPRLIVEERAGDLRSDGRPVPGRAPDANGSAERVDAVGKARRPEPHAGSAPPTPSSTTSTTRRSSWRPAVTVAAVAPAYLATLVRVSLTR